MNLRQTILRLQAIESQGHGDRDLVITDEDGVQAMTPCTIAYNAEDREVLIVCEEHLPEDEDEDEDFDDEDDDDSDSDLDESEDDEE